MEQIQESGNRFEFKDQIIDAMLVAKEWLNILSKIELKDEVRAAKAIEVAIKLSAQICVLGLRQLKQTDQDIAQGLQSIILDNAYTIERDAIYRYSIASQKPEPEIVAKLYKKYDHDNKGIFGRAERKKTVELISAREYKERMAQRQA